VRPEPYRSLHWPSQERIIGAGSESRSKGGDLCPLHVDLRVQPEVWAGLIRSPENREEVVGRILEEAGRKLRGLWFAFGEGDGFALIEAPDNSTAAAGIAIVIESSGAFRKFEATPLISADGGREGAGNSIRPLRPRPCIRE
jgi:uncharacterized protein with GYD domain